MLPAMAAPADLVPPHLRSPELMQAKAQPMPLYTLPRPVSAQPLLERNRYSEPQLAAAPSVHQSLPRLSFAAPLTRAVIESRPSRFIMRVRVGSETLDAYCPTTTRIGGLSAVDLLGAQVPCLLSVPASLARRRTRLTVEAISLDAPDAHSPSWVGINQAATNLYMGHFLSSGALPALCSMPGRLEREHQVGSSRIDFLYEGRDALEVKTPLSPFPLERIGNPYLLHALENKKHYLEWSDYTRFLRHLDALRQALYAQRRALGLPVRPRKAVGRQPGDPRAAVLHCHLLDAPPPSLAPEPRETPTRAAVRAKIERSLRAGIEFWQVNLLVDEGGVTLQKYFPILK